jgi:YggT family protein
MRELLFIADWIFAFVVGIFLLRLLFQLVRSDFRNPFVQALMRLTNPVILPLRRVLPPIGRVDTASVVAVLLIQVLATVVLTALMGLGLPSALGLLARAVLALADTTLSLYVIALIGYVLLSWVAPDGYNPVARVVSDLVAPVLRPLRRTLPTLGGLDLSPAVALLLLAVLRMVLNDRLAPQLLTWLR